MLSRLAAIPNLQVSEGVPLSGLTRFSIGGPARLLVDAATETALVDTLGEIGESHLPVVVIGGGTNLIVADAGFDGVVLRFTGNHIETDGSAVRADAGAALQSLVDTAIGAGLRGIETMTRIPGWVGGAIYGNAGAYGQSIHERVESVRFFDGHAVREIDNAACEFRYRESIFKRRKDWIVLSATLRLEHGDQTDLRARAEEIRRIRDEKYPPSMRCAGSIFKNLLLVELSEQVRAQVPARVIRDGKVASAYFLEEAGAKGMRDGAIRVADYHANLIYNEGGGTAVQLQRMIGQLKRRVVEQFGLELEEEVQFVASQRELG